MAYLLEHLNCTVFLLWDVFIRLQPRCFFRSHVSMQTSRLKIKYCTCLLLGLSNVKLFTCPSIHSVLIVRRIKLKKGYSSR